MIARERVARASIGTVSGLFISQVRQHPERIALEDWGSSRSGPPEPVRRFSYRQLEQRMLRLAGALAARGVQRGDRVALLSENRAEYLEVFLAAGCLGASVACQNWRLSAAELSHCLGLVEPRLLLVSPRYAEHVPANAPTAITFGAAYEAMLEQAVATSVAALEREPADGEAPLLILCTSGTTGLPK